MNTTTFPAPDLSDALAAAACLIAAAALVRTTGAAGVRVVVCGAGINIQIPPREGEQATREATVAVYAQVLGTPVTRQHNRAGGSTQTWTQTCGTLGGHDVHVWTITDPSKEA